VKLTIHDDWPKAIYTEAAIGDSQNNPSRADAHDMAIKTAESQAFKRCAVNLGDQFGLSLYKDVTTSAVVRDTLVKPEVVTDEPTIGTEQTSGTENPESE
jgi:hypothetical protein